MNKKRTAGAILINTFNRTVKLIEPWWLGVAASLFFTFSSSVLAQDTPGKGCESERQKVLAAYSGNTNCGDTGAAMKDVNDRIESRWDMAQTDALHR